MGSSAFLLPMEAQGIYRAMLTQAWRRGARLPNDHEAIQRAIGCTVKEWRRSWPRIERFWKVVDGHLINETQVEVYADAKARMEVASTRASAGARARWNKHQAQAQEILEHSQSNANGNGKAVLTQCPPISDLRSPSQERQKNISVEDEIARKAGAFLEKYPQIYAEERRGAHFQLKPVLHFMTACELVQGWPDERRLELMFRTFCRLPSSEKMAWPGTPAQFLHLAPELDAKLREAGV